MEIDMTNIAYTQEYKKYLKQYESIFDRLYYKEMERMELSAGYVVEESSYAGEMEGRNITASESVLKDCTGKELHRYRNIDTGGSFHTLIHHSDTGYYLIYKIDLYGYAVFDLSSGKEFVHIPAGPESFIWTGVNYNPENDLLVVSGCFWACPYGTHILDFSDPMKVTRWIDIHRLIDDGYEKYDDVDFDRWENDTLILKVYDNIAGQSKEMRLSKKEYMG